MSKPLKRKKRHYHIKAEGIAACNCCKLSYWQSRVLGGLTIVLEKKDFPDNYDCIDIPYGELRHLQKIIKKALEEIV